MLSSKGENPMMRWYLQMFVGVLALVAGEVGAHSFQVGFLAPTPDAQSGPVKQALDGFMLATAERDSHPDEHSDGHLGGLDVYVRPIDTAQGLEITRRLVGQLVHQENVEVVTGVMTPDLLAVVREELAGTPAVLLAVDDSRFTSADSSDATFVEAFRAAYGHSPSRAAREGYCIAKTIDRAVRALAGDFSDPDRVAALFVEAGCRQ
jgi:ABC-type branched-subunit amino acid transport system substrate-binding protein